ncbi:MAG: helix-turn-helix domain-containing protein [Cytophagales bacterium]|jgi:hypothetical protein|nr:helix-turn-helix domain-containing protein [Cytophagales bacterium]MCA6390752.1 helix-turn-helix domain-containing protein [Cytophagales bacterium]MCA6403920.1 helix-turn-helix domain-containing protein [Cytophagales bacterium]MCA6405830.1 helix-turn-helix domain-containing protein [Cytophagales bacterium]MCA6408870.1 helix-turn-helix domain-containing protein [Cytophagales bacterium]
MQHLQIQFPDQNDVKSLLKEVKLELLKEVQALEISKEPKVEYLTRQEIANKYRISLPTLHKHTTSGLPSIKIGKRRIYDPVEVAKYFKEKNLK